MEKTHTFTNSIVLTGNLAVLFDQVTAPGNWLAGPRHPQTYGVRTMPETDYTWHGKDYTNIWETPELGDKFIETTKSGPFKQRWVWEVIGLEHNQTIIFRGTAWGLSAILAYEFTKYDTRFMFSRHFNIITTNLATRLSFPLFRKDIRDSGNEYFNAIRNWWGANK